MSSSTSLKSFPALTANRLKNLILVLLVVGSLAFTLSNRSVYEHIAHQAQTIRLLGIILLVCEICFVAGALIMMASLGVQLEEGTRLKRWWGHLKYARQEFKTVASQALTSRLFGFGFWLNFAGALGTSLVLAFTVLTVAPATGIGLLIVIGVDLVATFAWRVPLHYLRRSKIKHERN
jgi:hypothetical protein